MKIRFCLLNVGLMLSGMAMGQGNPEVVGRLLDEGRNHNQVVQRLHELTHKIGARLTGSPELQRAQDWAVGKFKSFGITQVRLEKWGEVPVGFQRGPRQTVRMTVPYVKDFVFSTAAWSAGTNGKVSGEALFEPTTQEEFAKVKDQIKGKWLVSRQSVGMRGPNGANADLNKAILGAQPLGWIYGENSERVHTHGRFAGVSMDKLPTEVKITVRASDMQSIQRCLVADRTIKIEADIENRFIKGPVPQYNVVAEIPGSEKPDEVVIVCGHFDSWNGPGSQGASDNGTGSVVAIEAARLMMKAGAKPKRTVRFILWSGEEQGLLGSKGYVDAHKAEMPKISAVFNDDGGSNYQGGYACVESMKPMLEAAMAPMSKVFPEFPQKIVVQKALDGGGSSDHAPFVWAGVPGFFTIETGKQDYGFVWHTQNDRFENAIPEYLVQSSTNAAVVAYNIACAETLLPRVPPKEDKPADKPKPPVGGATYFRDEDDHRHDLDYVFYKLDIVARKLGCPVRFR